MNKGAVFSSISPRYLGLCQATTIAIARVARVVHVRYEKVIAQSKIWHSTEGILDN